MSAVTCPLGEACPGLRCPLAGAGGQGEAVVLYRAGGPLRPEPVARAMLELRPQVACVAYVLPLGAEGIDRALAVRAGSPVTLLDLAAHGWVTVPGELVEGTGAEVLAARIRGALRVANAERVWDAFVSTVLQLSTRCEPLQALDTITAAGRHLRIQTALTPARRARLVGAFNGIRGRLWTGGRSN